MKSEMRSALDTCMDLLVTHPSNDTMDKILGAAALTLLEGLIDAVDRQAAALERIAATLEEIEPGV